MRDFYLALPNLIIAHFPPVTGLNLGRLQYRETNVAASETTARLTALKPDMHYRVFLSASSAAGKGEPIFLDAQTAHAGRKYTLGILLTNNMLNASCIIFFLNMI